MVLMTKMMLLMATMIRMQIMMMMVAANSVRGAINLEEYRNIRIIFAHREMGCVSFSVLNIGAPCHFQKTEGEKMYMTGCHKKSCLCC